MDIFIYYGVTGVELLCTNVQLSCILQILRYLLNEWIDMPSYRAVKYNKLKMNKMSPQAFKAC